MPELDLLDRKIMYELDLNSRISASQLARKLRKSKETVNFRLNRLLSEGFLKGFYAVFNTSKMGRYFHKIYVKFKGTTPQKEKEMLDYMKRQEHIAYLATVEGSFDAIFLIMARSPKDMADFIRPFMKLYGDCIQQKDMAIILTAHRINEKFLFAGSERRDWHYPLELGDYPLDSTNLSILECLASNCRLPLIEIAKKAGVDSKIVKYRMKKLERDGIILAYVSSPNFDRLNLQFVQINISLKDTGAIRSMIEYFDSTNRCLFALELLGRFDLTVEVHVENAGQLRAIVDGFREKFVGKYNDYDVATITKEHVVDWGPFSWAKRGK